VNMDPGYCWPDERSVMFTRPRRCSGSHHITSLVSRSVSGWDEVRPWLVAMLQCQRLLSPAPHTMLRIVFVAVDRTQTERSAPHLALMHSPGENAGRCGLTSPSYYFRNRVCDTGQFQNQKSPTIHKKIAPKYMLRVCSVKVIYARRLRFAARVTLETNTFIININAS